MMILKDKSFKRSFISKLKDFKENMNTRLTETDVKTNQMEILEIKITIHII